MHTRVLLLVFINSAVWLTHGGCIYMYIYFVFYCYFYFAIRQCVAHVPVRHKRKIRWYRSKKASFQCPPAATTKVLRSATLGGRRQPQILVLLSLIPVPGIPGIHIFYTFTRYVPGNTASSACVYEWPPQRGNPRMVLYMYHSTKVLVREFESRL